MRFVRRFLPRIPTLTCRTLYVDPRNLATVEELDQQQGTFGVMLLFDLVYE